MYSSRLQWWVVCAVMLVPTAACHSQQRLECLPCHGVSGFSVQASDGDIVSLHVNPTRYEKSVHGDLFCYQCHVNMAIQPHGLNRAGIPDIVEPYVLKWRPMVRPAAAACITCHAEIFKQYRNSDHARALRRGYLDAPFCPDCHGSHYMLGTEDLESQINPRNVPATCASCHSIGLLMSRYDVATNTYETFEQSVHGRKLALGERDVAVCTSCHGVHDIRSASDPGSRLNPDNITETCRECHKGASREFALSFRHIVPSPTVEPVIYWFQTAYRWLIIILVGGMAAFVFLDVVRHFIETVRMHSEESVR